MSQLNDFFASFLLFASLLFSMRSRAMPIYYYYSKTKFLWPPTMCVCVCVYATAGARSFVFYFFSFRFRLAVGHEWKCRWWCDLSSMNLFHFRLPLARCRFICSYLWFHCLWSPPSRSLHVDGGHWAAWFVLTLALIKPTHVGIRPRTQCIKIEIECKMG